MKNVKPYLGVAIALTLIYLVYLLFKRSRTMSVALSNGDVVLPEANGGGAGAGSTDVGCRSNCCQNPCTSIDLESPSANYGCCGAVVQQFQQQLNAMAGVGINLNPDGAYGQNTQAAHQQVLNANNGTWPEFIGPTQPA